MTLPWARFPHRVALRRLPARVQFIVLLIGSGAVGVGIIAATLSMPWSEDTALVAAQLFVLIVAAQCYPVQLVPNTTVLPTTAPLFASVLLLPLPLALALTAAALPTAFFLRRGRPGFHVWFNTAAVMVQVAAAGAMAGLFGWTPGQIDAAGHPLLVLAPLFAATVMYVTNLLFVELVLAIQLQRQPWLDFRERWARTFLEEGTLFLVGALFVRTALHAPWLLSLMAVPLIVVYRALRDSTALRGSEARFRALVQHAADVILIVDRQGRLGYVSAASCAVFGEAPEALARDHLLARVHPNDRPVLQTLLNRVPADATDGDVPVIQCRHVDGTWRAVEVHSTALWHEPGIAGVVLTLRDITQRRRTEQAQQLLVEATGRFAASLDEAHVLEQFANLVVPALADWCIIDRLDAETDALRPAVVAHPAGEQATGLAASLRNEAPPRSVPAPVLRAISAAQSDLHVGDAEIIWPLFTRGCAEASLPRTAGDLSYLALPLVAGDKALGVVSLLRLPTLPAFDAHDRALLESLADRAALCLENARLYDEAQTAVRLRDEFFAATSHDLRTPVTTIAGFAQVLARQLPLARSEQRRTACLELVEGIEQGARRLAGQIDQILDVSRLQSSQDLELHRAPADLVALVRSVCSDQQRVSPRHDLILDLGAPVCVGLWDAARLDRLITNLIVNAVKYSPAGGRVVVRVMQELGPDGAWATLSVQDEGVGVPPSEQRRIFTRYYRASNVDARIAGSGIGLANVAEIVRLHGGQVSVDSSEGQGSVFRVRLPLLPAAGAYQSNQVHESLPA